MPRAIHAQPLTDALAKYEQQCRGSDDWRKRSRAGETLANTTRKLLHGDDIARIKSNDILREAAAVIELLNEAVPVMHQDDEARVNRTVSTIARELGE